MNTNAITKILALFFTGLLAGTFYYATANVLPTFGEVPDSIHLIFRTALMKHNSINMQLLMALSIATGAWLAWQVRHSRVVFYLAVSASLLALTSLLVTRLGSVPINMQIKTWDAGHPPQAWQNTLSRWNLFHSIRTYTSIASFFCTIVVCQVKTTFSQIAPGQIRSAIQ